MANPFEIEGSPTLGGKLFDAILNRTGAIGSKIQGFKFKDYTSEVLSDAGNPASKAQRFKTKIITSDNITIVFDATTEVTAEYPSKVTQYPVEDGATISDHVINENPKFSVSGIFSDYSASLNPEKGSTLVSEVYQRLFAMRDKREVVSLLTSLDQYTDLIVTNISTPKKTGQGDALYVDLTFEKIRKVKTGRTVVVKTGSPAAIKAADNKNLGTKTPDLLRKPEWDEEGLQQEFNNLPFGVKDKYLANNAKNGVVDDGTYGSAAKLAAFLQSQNVNVKKYAK